MHFRCAGKRPKPFLPSPQHEPEKMGHGRPLLCEFTFESHLRDLVCGTAPRVLSQSIRGDRRAET